MYERVEATETTGQAPRTRFFAASGFSRAVAVAFSVLVHGGIAAAGFFFANNAAMPETAVHHISLTQFQPAFPTPSHAAPAMNGASMSKQNAPLQARDTQKTSLQKHNTSPKKQKIREAPPPKKSPQKTPARNAEAQKTPPPPKALPDARPSKAQASPKSARQTEAAQAPDPMQTAGPAQTPDPMQTAGPAQTPEPAPGGLLHQHDAFGQKDAAQAPGSTARNDTAVSGNAKTYTEDTVDQRPSVSRRVLPEYPEYARRRKIQGEVVVRLIVDAQGKPRQCTVVSSRPEKIFDAAALAAASKTRFVPGKVHGRPVNTIVLIPYRFTLR